MKKQRNNPYLEFFPFSQRERGYNRNAFTLVELIVVITILAILGTIAFISLQGYSSNSRDSVRISDISSLKTSLELFNLEAGKYPIPTNGVDITYSGAVVWNQGTFGKTVYVNVSKLDKIPLDPTTDKEYTYSVNSNRYEYQLGGIMEGDVVVYNHHPSPLPRGEGIEQLAVATSLPLGEIEGGLYAGETTATAYVTGNYNGLMTKSLSGTTCNVLSIPTIITNDTSVTDLQQIVTNNSFVYRGYKNLPSSFKTSKFKYNGGFSFTPNNLIAYTDTGSCTALTSTTSSTARVNLLKGLQDAYSGTIVKNEGEIKNIVSLSINTSSPSNDVINYAGSFVNNNLGGNVVVYDISSSSGNTTSCISGYEWDGFSCYLPINYPSGVNILSTTYFTAIDNTDNHISPNYNILKGKVYVNNPVITGSPTIRSYDSFINNGFWGINNSGSGNYIVLNLTQPEYLTHFGIGFANSTNKPTSYTISSFDGVSWVLKYSNTVGTTYISHDFNLGPSSIWKIEFFGGGSIYYVDGGSLNLQLQ